MLFKDSKVIFIHIPKTGGSSFRDIIRDKGISHVNMFHGTAKEIKESYPKEWENYFKFIIVRNPWDRWVSVFSRMMMANILTKRLDVNWDSEEYFEISKDFFKEFTKTFLVEFFNNIEIGDNYKFMPLKRCCAKLEIKDHLFYDGALHLAFLYHQHYWYGELLNDIDYIIRFENLEQDLTFILKNKVEVSNFKMKHSRLSKRKKDYRLYYDDDLVDIVYNIYSKEIDKLGYKFE